MKRRIIGLLLAGVMVCSAAGCQKETTSKQDAKSVSSQSAEETAQEETAGTESVSSSGTEASTSTASSSSSAVEDDSSKEKKIEITIPHKDGMVAAYDTVEGLSMEAGSYIAVVAKDLDSGYWKAVKAGAEQAIAELNEQLGYTGNDKIRMTFEGPQDESDTNEQISTIDSVISENPNVLVLGIIDQQSGQAQMEEASDSQIPVVIIDSGSDSDMISATCATDNQEAARKAAEKLCESIGNKGQVAIVAHQYNTKSSTERVQAFRDEIEEKYKEVSVVQVNYGDGEESVSDMLKNTLEAYPELKGIFCTNEDMANATLDALDKMENTEQIQIVGFDSGEKQIRAIREGREYGAISQNPYGLGYATIVAAVRTAEGLPVDKKIDTGYQWMDKNTIDLEQNQKYIYD